MWRQRNADWWHEYEKIGSNNAFWCPDDSRKSKEEVEKEKEECTNLGAIDPEELCGIIDSLSSNKDSAAEEEHKELCEK